jgi:hypothetical protein
MKTKLIVFASLLMFGCKKETPQPSCQCSEVTEVSFVSGVWYHYNTTEPTSMLCSENGKVIDTWTETESGFTAYYKKQIVCE